MLNENKELLLKILKELELLKTLLPHELSLSEISNLTGVSNNTLRKYILCYL